VIEQVLTADAMSLSKPERAAWIVTKRGAALGLATCTWKFDLVRPPSVLPLPLETALDAGTPATLHPPGIVAKAADGPFVEYGAQTPELHEYFMSKSGPCGVVHVRRKDAGWSASMPKTSVPYVLSKDAVESGWMPEPGRSAMPASLERVVPKKFQYWNYPQEQAGAVRNALVEAGTFDDRLVKIVDDELRLCHEKLYLYEPDGDAVEKSTPAPLSLRDALAKVLGQLATKKVLTPLVGGADPAEVINAAAPQDTLALVSSPKADNIAEVVKAIAKAAPLSWLLEHDDTPEARVEMGKIGRVFKLDVEGARDRVFVASFHPADISRVSWIASVVKADIAANVAKAAAKAIDFQGLTIKVDRHVGFVQTGKDENGEKWSRTYAHDYGYIPRTKGGDGDQLDVFLGNHRLSKRVFWITQKDRHGAFDEFKVMLGFPDEDAARAAYLKHVPEKHLGQITEGTIDQMKALLNVHPEEVVKREVRLMKASASEVADERYILGIVLEPEVIDAQKDIYSDSEIRSSAHKFMQHFRTIGLMHKGAINDKVKILESYIAPTDFEVGDQPVKKGTWLMAVHVLDDELWKAAKAGELTGFSIGGSAVRTPDPGAAGVPPALAST
jgi:hypothetical protein